MPAVPRRILPSTSPGHRADVPPFRRRAMRDAGEHPARRKQRRNRDGKCDFRRERDVLQRL